MTEQPSRRRMFVNRWIALLRFGPKAIYDAGHAVGYLEGLRDAPRAAAEGKLFTPPTHTPSPSELEELMQLPTSQEALRAAEARDERIRRWNKR